jgi:hypothetical protein
VDDNRALSVQMFEQTKFICIITILLYGVHTVKKVMDFPVPSRKVTNQTPWPGIIKLFPSRESVVSDFPAGDEKIYNFFTV